MDWMKTIASAAPILGTVIGGPVGAVAGKGLQLVASLFGCEPTEDAVAEAIKLDPEAALKLKQLENDNQALLLRWQERQLDAELENTKDARKREVELTRSGSMMGVLPPALISLVVSIGFFIMLYFVLTLETEPSQAALLLLGALSTAFGAVVNYYLGSSLGSYRKNTALEQQAVGAARATGKAGGI